MLHSKQNGYTLVEVIVALGIFVTIATIATGALISILKTQQSTYDQQTAAQQLRFFQDVFSRDVRESSSITCDQDDDTITLKNTTNAGSAGQDIEYSFAENTQGTGLVVLKNGDRIMYFPLESHWFDCRTTGTTSLVTLNLKFVHAPQWFEMTVQPRFPASVQ